MKPWLKNVLIGGTLFLEVWLNGQRIDLSVQKISIANTPTNWEQFLPLADEHTNLKVEITTLPSPPGPACISYILWDGDGNGKVELADAIGPLKVLSGDN